jgi:sigma-E factor negative regulatory protein RseA
MNDNRNADISALMDGELGSEARARVIARAAGDPAQQDVWRHFHLIGDALRGDPVLAGADSIAPGVMAALAHEPTLLVPRRRDATSRRVVAGAIAASVAVIAVFGLQGRIDGLDRGDTPAIAGLRVSPPLAPAPGGAAPEAVAAGPVDAEVLQRYFMSHSELRANQAIRPQPPHASLVGFSPEPAEARGAEAPEPAPAPAPAGGVHPVSPPGGTR